MYPVLMGWISDLKDQFTLACVSSLACAVCMVTYATLDHTHTPSRPRTAQSTMSVLHSTHQKYPNASAIKFASIIKDSGTGLSGRVEHPFWDDLNIDPSFFLHIDILHGMHKFFWDHVRKWTTHVISDTELDHHLMVQPKVGLHHFKHGISKITQACGQEY